MINFKNLGGGLFFIIIVGTEVLPLFYYGYSYKREPHFIERNYGAEYNNMASLTITRITDTTTSGRISNTEGPLFRFTKTQK